ncbi:MAG TPA: zinc dependent phospholipase C family protein [Rectinemataceae bacterium]|nr:zinc dependent phospholipase C family protein [Rectinemataceae bacterium]
MAGQITHILVGEAALRGAAPAEAEAVLRSSGGYFRLGCQGPDIFYHNQRTMPSGLHYGALAHRRDYGRVIEGGLESLPRDRLAPESPAVAYALGLATHAAVDRATHPFIVFYAGWADPARPGTERFRACHPFFERLLDLALLSHERGIDPSDFDMEKLMAPSSQESAQADSDLVTLWAAGLRKAFPRSTGGDQLIEQRVANALADARHFIRLTNPRRTAMLPGKGDWFTYLNERVGPRSVALIYPDSLPAEIDIESLGREGWEHPAGDGRSFSSTYLDLIGGARSEAETILRRMLGDLAGGSIPDGLGELIGNAGLSVNDRDGRHVPPLLSRPLPLPELMDREYRVRLRWAQARSHRAGPPH